MSNVDGLQEDDFPTILLGIKKIVSKCVTAIDLFAAVYSRRLDSESRTVDDR